MSIAILEKLFGAVERGDLETYLTCFTDDAEYKVGNSPAITGPKVIGEFGAKIMPLFDKVEHKIKSTWETGNVIIAELEIVYHRKDGKAVTIPCVDIIELENEKVKSLRVYQDAAPLAR